MNDNKVLNGIIWKTLERLAVLGTQFVIQIVLARLLSPEDYGSLSIMMVFLAVANILVQSGLNTALIQKKDTQEEDYSTVLWVSLLISLLLYIIIFIMSPFVAGIYNNSQLTHAMRVIAITLFPGAFNSVQLAKITREMNFKKVFYSNFIAVTFSGVVGIIIASNGGGLWALVAQSVVNVSVVCIIMLFVSGLKLHFYFNKIRAKALFDFGWKLAVSNLLSNISENIKSLFIGLKYDVSDLGFYSRGMQFPQYGINIIQGSIGSVMLPAISEKQSDKKEAKEILKNTIKLSTYFIFPMMAGMAAIAETFIKLLLTDKWMDAAPYMMIYCVIYAVHPIHVCNLQATSALGRSDTYLKLEVIKQIINIISIAVAIVFFSTPKALAYTSLILTPLGLYLNNLQVKKSLNYSAIEQLADYFPQMIMSIVLFLIVYFMGRLFVNDWVRIVFQICFGIVVYILLSLVTSNSCFRLVVNRISKRLIR